MHSHRHFFDTRLRTRVADEKLRRVTGNRSVAMSNRYTHFQLADFDDVLRVQEELLA